VPIRRPESLSGRAHGHASLARHCRVRVVGHLRNSRAPMATAASSQRFRPPVPTHRTRGLTIYLPFPITFTTCDAMLPWLRACGSVLVAALPRVLGLDGCMGAGSWTRRAATGRWSPSSGAPTCLAATTSWRDATPPSCPCSRGPATWTVDPANYREFVREGFLLTWQLPPPPSPAGKLAIRI
jgi:hypothetical protein